jgi:hypothetical protein
MLSQAHAELFSRDEMQCLSRNPDTELHRGNTLFRRQIVKEQACEKNPAGRCRPAGLSLSFGGEKESKRGRGHGSLPGSPPTGWMESLERR